MTQDSAATRRLVILGRARQALGVPFFSRGAAFLLDAMAALPRKSDPDGAASLPWRTIALARGGASRECGKLTLRRFSFGSAADELDDEAGEEGDGVEVGFGFGDGSDLGSGACESSLKSASNGGGSGVAVEADIGEVGGKGRVGAESQRAYGFVEVSAHGHATAIEIDGSVVVDGVLCCDQEGTTVVQDDLGGVGEGVGGFGFKGPAVNSGGSRVSVVSSAALPVVMPEMRLSDHLCYWDEGFPALMLTDTALFRHPNYHKHTDTVETLDFEAMASITENLLSAIQKIPV